MDPSPKNNRGAPHLGPVKLEVPKRCRPTGPEKRLTLTGENCFFF